MSLRCKWLLSCNSWVLCKLVFLKLRTKFYYPLSHSITRLLHFLCAGESYGGHYVPNLALAIHEGNKQARLHNDPEINLKGMLIGNAWTDAAIDNRGALVSGFGRQGCSSAPIRMLSTS